MMKRILFLPVCLLLSGCFQTGLGDWQEPDQPSMWENLNDMSLSEGDVRDLEKWWTRFEDPALDALVAVALEESPDRKIAEARLLQARGLRRSQRSYLLPQVGASASGGWQDTGSAPKDDYYDAGFDASYEIDVFGKNRNDFSASSAAVRAAEAGYDIASVALVGEVVRGYIDFRAAQNQFRIARKNLKAQEKTLVLISDLYRLGSSPRLDVQRAANLVNTTRASLPEYQRQAENARLQLSILTGRLPGDIAKIVAPHAVIPDNDVQPVLYAPAAVLTMRPDVLQAQQNLIQKTHLSKSAFAMLFPTLTLEGFYGLRDGPLISSATVWDLAVGAAVNLLDFGRIEGQIDAAKASEQEAFAQYRKVVISAVVEVETALNDYGRYLQKYKALQDAHANAQSAFELSQTLFKEGEVSFLDVLDSQRSLNNAESSVVEAKASLAQSTVRLFKAMGVY